MLYSYKMIVDRGFAPNPFFGYLTLATCKPGIRKTKKIGDYVAGFTSAGMINDYKPGMEQMIYIMKISEKMSYEKYFNDPRFKRKIPSDDTAKTRAGDNIYHLVNNCYTQVKSKYHTSFADKQRDLTCHKVLVADEFYYFGDKPFCVDGFNIKKPSSQSAYGVLTKDETAVEILWNHLCVTYKSKRILGNPHHFDL
ncbi:MAG: hypothetical protein ACTHMM_26945 [Agriterribacter sp.]